MTNSPCYKCPIHTTVCHASCEAYREWTVKLESQRKQQKVTADADAHTKDTIERICKRAHTKRRVGQR